MADQAIFGIIGNPLAHSLSPVMHNAAYREMGFNGHYLTFETGNLRDIIDMIRERNISGVSVTLPFKEEVLDLMDDLDSNALRIGSVNTVTNRNGRLLGSNTDWLGLIQDIRDRFEIRGKTVAVLGAGGAARAAVYAIHLEGGSPVVVNRTAARGENLATEFGCAFLPLSEIGVVDASGLINTTPVGMMPHEDESPVPARALRRFGWVMDIVYNPPFTRLLKEAREKGCKTVDGIGMFVNQGAEQIRLWTGKKAPRGLMRRVVEEELRQRSEVRHQRSARSRTKTNIEH
ncbi:MAG: shikimate dehydrogenase [Deltaproteobacteria bacterium HGW-Deltaproteobacteria-21]|nr:MAG: shikimate dehydrogenase [Deltaproteobacteria bacterium HGW-Deltaproteobacteria-21]